MINLMTTRRRVATLTALTAALIGSIAEAQDTNSLLLLNDVPISVLEKQIEYGAPLASEIQPVLAAAGQELFPSSMGLDYETLPEMPDEVDVLTRGPLHEAFATAHQSNPQSSPVVRQAPPQLIDEVPPQYKPEGNNVQWIAGYWAWDDAQQDFIWISGLWRDVPPQRHWVPGYWDKANAGYHWISGFWAEETQQELGYLPQPPVSIEQGPSTAAPSDNHFYVPGNWHYQDQRYRWSSGHWQPVVENRIWIPAQYVWTPRGCIYRSGYWDYEFDHRGTCFAPVHFKRPVYLATNYSYQPSFAINLNIDFLTHLFVRPHCTHYYYGDWYSSNFADFGYRPWVSHQSHYRSYDPLLTYYQCRRSSFDRRYSTVQYLAKQHLFYANNISYRPRPTFVAQFNFSKNNYKQNHRYSDYLGKSNYVGVYSNNIKIPKSNNKHRSLKLPAGLSTYQIKKLLNHGGQQQLKRLANQSQTIRNSSQLQRERDRQRRAVDQQRRKTAEKLAADRSRQQREQQDRLKKQKRQSEDRARERARQLQRDQENARIAARQKSERDRRAQAERQQRADQQQRRAQAERQQRADQQRRAQEQARRSQDQARKPQTNRSRQHREQQSRLQQQRRQAEDQARARQLQQQKRAQEITLIAARKKSEQDRRAQAERQQRADQQRRAQDQARRSQEQARKAKADRARQESARRAKQDAARKAQQKSQRDAARKAQQKSQRDAARRAQKQKSKKSKKSKNSKKKKR